MHFYTDFCVNIPLSKLHSTRGYHGNSNSKFKPNLTNISTTLTSSAPTSTETTQSLHADLLIIGFGKGGKTLAAKLGAQGKSNCNRAE